ncbi:MAG: glycosyltransferase family 39 protein [Cyanobacteria bacterium RUI128]|nr:glycosyltransferase family 39 protein [Cyanobacteria bacterium RUI128]
MDKFFNKIIENKAAFWIVFGVIILVSLGLRLTLIEFPLWYDEGCSIAAAIKSFPAGITDYLWNHDLMHTPFYFYILHYIMQFFGDSVVVLRVSSLLVSMALLPITYIVTEKLSSKKIALFAMLLMGINTFQVLYSIEIRMYPYVILLSLLSINYLIDYDRNGDKASLIKLGIVNFLNPYFLTGSIVFVIAQFIIYSSYLDFKHADSKKISNYVISNLFVFLGFIPYLVLIIHYGIVRSHFLVTDISPLTQINFWGLLQNLVSCDPGHIHETRFEAFKDCWQTYFLVFAPMIMMAVGLLKSLTDKERLNRVILGIIALCFIVFVFLSNVALVAFTGRYLIYITPFIFILAAIGLGKFNKYIVLLLTLLYTTGCIYGLFSTYKMYRDIAEFSLKSPADFCKNNYPGKQNLVIMPFASSVSFYYFQGEDMPRVMPIELLHMIRDPENKFIYDDEQIQAFKTGDKAKIFQNIITGDKYISKNFAEYMDSYLKTVPKGGYIIWIVYYTDNYAIKRPEEVKRLYSDYNFTKENASTGMLSKFDLDLIAMLSQRAEFVRKDRDASNQFFVFRKR